MKREQVNVVDLPLPDGAYSKAIKVNGFVYTSGMGALNPPGDLAAQTKKTLEYLELVLNEANTSLKNAIKISVFIHDIDEWEKFNEAYKNYFNKFDTFLPVRTTVEASKFPEGQCIEIDVIACNNN